MKIIAVHDDQVILQIGECRHRLTVEQIAYIVRQAYWQLDQRSGAYLARIIADALIEPPVEAPPDAVTQHIRSGLRDTERALRKAIREANSPGGREHAQTDSSATLGNDTGAATSVASHDESSASAKDEQGTGVPGSPQGARDTHANG